MQPATKPVAQPVPSRPSSVVVKPADGAAHGQQQAVHGAGEHEECRTEQE